MRPSAAVAGEDEAVNKAISESATPWLCECAAGGPVICFVFVF